MTSRFPASFDDRAHPDRPDHRAMWRIMREGGFSDAKAAAAAAPSVPRIAEPDVPHVTQGTAVTWLGHAGFLVQTGGVRFLLDPVFSAKIPGGLKRLVPSPPLAALPGVDALLITHNHYDHLDAPSVKALPRDTQVLVPANQGAWFTRKGFTHVTEMDWWDHADVNGVRVDFVPSQHWSRRGVFDTNRSLWGGFVLTAPNGDRVYDVGDTGYGPFYRDVAERLGAFDVVLNPVGAYEPRWFMRVMHQNPEEALQAMVDLGAARMVPMHWGAFALTREPLLEPLERTRAAWRDAGRATANLWDVAVGETRSL